MNSNNYYWDDVILSIILLIDEVDRIPLRLISTTWNNVICNACVKDHVHWLIRQGKYISAFKLLAGRKSDRRGFPLKSRKALHAAHDMSHYNLTKYILQNYQLYNIDKLIKYVCRYDYDCAKLFKCDRRMMMIFLSHGHRDRNIWYLDAATINDVKMAGYLTEWLRNDSGIYLTEWLRNDSGIYRSIMFAAHYDNPAMARIIMTYNDCVTPDSIFESVLKLSTAVAIELIHSMTIDSIRFALSNPNITQHADVTDKLTQCLDTQYDIRFQGENVCRTSMEQRIEEYVLHYDYQLVITKVNFHQQYNFYNRPH